MLLFIRDKTIPTVHNITYIIRERGPYEPIGLLLIKYSNTLLIYCVRLLHNIHGYENNLCVMEAGMEALSSYGKRADTQSALVAAVSSLLNRGVGTHNKANAAL